MFYPCQGGIAQVLASTHKHTHTMFWLWPIYYIYIYIHVRAELHKSLDDFANNATWQELSNWCPRCRCHTAGMVVLVNCTSFAFWRKAQPFCRVSPHELQPSTRMDFVCHPLSLTTGRIGRSQSHRSCQMWGLNQLASSKVCSFPPGRFLLSSVHHWYCPICNYSKMCTFMLAGALLLFGRLWGLVFFSFSVCCCRSIFALFCLCVVRFVKLRKCGVAYLSVITKSCFDVRVWSLWIFKQVILASSFLARWECGVQTGLTLRNRHDVRDDLKQVFVPDYYHSVLWVNFTVLRCLKKNDVFIWLWSVCTCIAIITRHTCN